MAKSTCLFALFVAVVVCTEAIRIDTAQPSPTTGKHFPYVKKNDARCKGRTNGLYADSNDCTRYIKCVGGDLQERKCPDDFKFDSIRYCIPPTAVPPPNCGTMTLSGPLDAQEKCPDTYGIFPVKSDCHKFMVCVDSVPNVKNCPSGYVYRDTNGACINGDKCPDQSSEVSECKRSNQLLADEKNCRRFIKCVNFQPLRKECPPATAFDPEKLKCTKEQLERCRNNDIRNVGQDE